MRISLLVCSLLFTAVLSVSCRSGAAPAPVTAQAVPRYVCPMHPQVVQDRKGDCPICGMDLVLAKEAPKAAPAGAAGAAHVEGAPMRAPDAASSAAIAVTPEQQGVIGLVVGEVASATGTRALRLVGRVTPDETRLYRVNAGIDGSVRDLTAASLTGSRVRRDQLLGSFYAPNALSTIQLFIVNTQGRERLAQRKLETPPQGAEVVSLGNANLQQRTMQLENIGMPQLQREQVAKEQRVPDTIQLRSPADGFVLERNVTPGMKFDRGAELFKIADLRRVWVIADVFPQDAHLVRPGMKAEVSLPEDGRRFPARVSEVLPQFDATTRTLKARLELDNPDLALRPDMFVDVTLSAELPSGLAVPADAIVDSGLAKHVFVQTAEGTFEPRRVETGWRSGDRIQVVRGLSEGEKIVTSGTFFLDSETRLRSPTSGAAAANDLAPVPTGHEPRSPGGAGSPSDAAPMKMPGSQDDRGDTGHAGHAGHGAHVHATEAAQARAEDAR